MNKIYIFAVLFIFSCSGSDEFSKENRKEIFIDGISYQFARDTLYLFEDIYIEGNGRLDNYLQNFFWVIDGDTIGSYGAKKKVSYGEHFIQLSLVDIWGDTLSYRDTVFIKEPLSVTPLSPVDKFLANDGIIEFQYKINGASEETQVFVHYCICEEYLEENWQELNGNILVLGEDASSPKKVFWLVEAREGEKREFSRSREIWLGK